MTDDKNNDTDALSKGIADLAEAALGVGVALGRTVAQATAKGRVEEPPADGQGQIGEMIHYGVSIVRNVMGLVFSAAGSATEQAGSAFSAARERTDQAPEKNIPTVHQGGTLRIPLSVENPSADAMADLRFQCNDIAADDLAGGTPIDGKSFRFEPASLDIAARDFEKLTLFINAPIDAAPGHYRAVVGVADNRVQLAVNFNVMPAAAS